MNDLLTKFGLLVFYMGVLYYLARYGHTFDQLFHTGFSGTEGLVSTLYGNPPFNTYGTQAPHNQVSYTPPGHYGTMQYTNY